MVEGCGLEGYLEAGATHAEVHCVHVNLAGIWFLSRGRRHVSLFVLINRDLDVHFLSPSLPNRFDQVPESRMGVTCVVKDELRF